MAVHQSPEAESVRAQINEAVKAGRSDTEIKAALIREYGHGILMEPEGMRALAAYACPLIALLLGLLGALRWIRSKATEPHDGVGEGMDALTLSELPDLEPDS